MSVVVDEVSLDLAVHDKHHKPVLDLKSDEIVVSDNGVPVTLRDFHLVRDTSTNRGHLVTFVFDRFQDAMAKNTQNVANKVLKVLPTRGYSIAVLDFNGRLRAIQPYTQDRNALEMAIAAETQSLVTRLESTHGNTFSIVTDKADPLRAVTVAEAEKNIIAIARTGIDSTGKRVSVDERARCQVLLNALEDTVKIKRDQHAMLNLAGLLALVRAQQRISDRKTIIYFTQNMYMDSAAKKMLETITSAATQAGVSIYTIDMDAIEIGRRYQEDNANLNGQRPFNPVAVATSPYTSEIPAQQRGSGEIEGAPSPDGRGRVWTESQDVLMATDFMRGRGDPFALTETKNPISEVSKNTGGLYIDAGNSLKKPLHDMLDEMTTYYQASYVPPPHDYDGKFRTIAIKPSRADLRIQSKTGYLALAPGADGSIQPFEVPLLKLLERPELPQDVKFHAAVLQFGEMPAGNSNTVAVEVPLSQLQVRKDTNTNLYSVRVSLVAQIKDESGTIIERFGEDIPQRGALEALDSNGGVSILFQRHFVSVPGKYVLESAVYDQQGEKAGAQRIPFEIGSSTSGPALSQIVLVRKAILFDQDDDPGEPLAYEKTKVSPNLSGMVDEQARTVSLFFVVHPDTKSTEPFTLEMEASRAGRAGKRVPLPLRVVGDYHSIPYMASFKAGSLAPGAYDVNAYLNQGGKTAVQHLSFFVPGDQVAEAVDGASQGHLSAGLDPVTPMPDAYTGGILAISSTSNPVPPPSAAEIDRLLTNARERALGYAESLPNFLCIEVTNRSVDIMGNGGWKHRDTIAELLRYRDKKESHSLLEVDGRPASSDRNVLLQQSNSTLSSGELGGVLKAVFDSSAKAEFHWKETDALGSGTVQVFNYHVSRGNSLFSVTGSNNKEVTVGFHGQVFIDPETHNVRRISLEAEDLPKDFPTHSTRIAVDYDYVAINGHDYLMPISAEVLVRQGRREAILNTMVFRDYRRFGSAMKILGYEPLEKP